MSTNGSGEPYQMSGEVATRRRSESATKMVMPGGEGRSKYDPKAVEESNKIICQAKGLQVIHVPNPPVYTYHYLNGRSQGALLCQTSGFPIGYDPESEVLSGAYSDRLVGWLSDEERQSLQEMARGSVAWPSTLPEMSDDDLREFARVALRLNARPKHVRVIYHYNVAAKHGTPVVQAICNREDEIPERPPRSRGETGL